MNPKNLEILDDASEEVDEDEIPDGLPGSKNPRPQPRYERTAPEILSNNSQSTPRRRGRPPGPNSKSKTNTASNTKVQDFWNTITALGLNLTSAWVAASVLRNRKYIMTKQEAEAAAKGIMLVAFKYKQFREFAVIVNTDNDLAIIARGFWPYMERVFFKEMIDDIVSRFFVFKPDGPKQRPTPNVSTNANRGNASPISNSIGSDGGDTISSANNANDGRRTEFTLPDGFSLPTNWRAL